MQKLIVSGDRILMPILPDTQDSPPLNLMDGNLRANPSRTNISSPPSPHMHDSNLLRALTFRSRVHQSLAVRFYIFRNFQVAHDPLQNPSKS